MNPTPLLWQYVVHVINSISSLSTVEFIKLVGNWHSLRLGSSKKRDNLEYRGYSIEALNEVKSKSTDKFNSFQSLGIKFLTPIDNFKSDILSYSLLLFENYERGVLPFPGSTSEQPSQIIEIFNVLSALRYEQEEISRKKLEKNVRNQHKGVNRSRR